MCPVALCAWHPRPFAVLQRLCPSCGRTRDSQKFSRRPECNSCHGKANREPQRSDRSDVMDEAGFDAGDRPPTLFDAVSTPNASPPAAAEPTDGSMVLKKDKKEQRHTHT